jgi:RNA polymerase sporulation-specific sigma factor
LAGAKPPVPGHREQLDLLARARKGDQEARARFVTENSPLIWGIVRRFDRLGHEPEDLFQVGCIGLLKAMDRFDEGFGTRFSTYALPLIIGEIRRHIRDQSPLRVPRGAKEMARRAWVRQEEMANVLGREPSVLEVATDLGVSPHDLVAAWEGLRRPAPLASGNDSPGIEDVVHDTSQSESLWATGVAIQEVLLELEPRERAVLVLRYLRDKTQEEVARALGISQAQVSRIEKSALENARLHLGGGD